MEFSYCNIKNGIYFRRLDDQCRITFLQEGIVRIEYAFKEADFDNHIKGAILRTERTDHAAYLDDEIIIVDELPFQVSEESGLITLTSSDLIIVIDTCDFSLKILDHTARVLHQDIPKRSYYIDKNDVRYHTFMKLGYRGFYGLGDKSGLLNKDHRRFRLSTNDAIGYDSENSDPLYKHIPFLILRDPEQDISSGIFYDVTCESELDVDCERSGYWGKKIEFKTFGGQLDYYFIHGDSIRQVVRKFTDITGKTRLPIYKSLGYLASTMYYTELKERSDSGIQRFLQSLDEDRFPLDAFHMSSGYTALNGKRYVFQWNSQRFPDPEAFVSWLREHQIFLSPNVKPALLTDHPLYEEFREAGAFIEDGRLNTPITERFWGGDASLVNFASPAGRSMWKRYLGQSLISLGIHYFWNDNNEYEIANDDAVIEYGGGEFPAKDLKSLQANLMAKTTIDALRSHNSNMRPFVLSRAGYAGIQRYAQTWTGDNYTSWHSLKFGIPILLGLGLSGIANAGSDIGGFMGPAPNPELFVRWVQHGVFHPRFCIHSCNEDNTVTNPNNYGAYNDLIRQAFDLRYSLALYLYSLFRIASIEGDPVMRPMIYEFERHDAYLDNSFDFLFGPYLLIANVVEEGAVTRQVLLPGPCVWHDWNTHKVYHVKNQYEQVQLEVGLEDIPIFYRQGCIIPIIKPGRRLSTDIETLSLLIECSEAGAFTMYLDDGVSNRYQHGEFLETEISTEIDGDTVKIHISKTGSFPDPVKQIDIMCSGRSYAPKNVTINREESVCCQYEREFRTCMKAFWYDITKGLTCIRMMNEASLEIELDYRIHDLVGYDGKENSL